MIVLLGMHCPGGYHETSHDSHLRFWPGGGGVSPNRNPFLPSCVPGPNQLPLDSPDLGLKFRKTLGDAFLNHDMLLRDTTARTAQGELKVIEQRRRPVGSQAVTQLATAEPAAPSAHPNRT